jgi:hypothetical protein
MRRTPAPIEGEQMVAKRDAPRRCRYIRYGDSEWALITAQAIAEGIDPSTYVREVSLREARRELAKAGEDGR